MRIRDTAERFGVVAILNHWVLALAVAGLLASGLIAAELAGEAARRALLRPHKALGVLVPVLAIWLVLWWRAQARRPGAVPDTPDWAARLRRAMHVFLIAGTIVMGVSGVAMAHFSGRAIEVFGLFAVPGGAEVPWLAAAAHTTHEIGGWVLLVAVLGHGAVALKHHLVDHDATVTRMLGRGA